MGRRTSGNQVIVRVIGRAPHQPHAPTTCVGANKVPRSLLGLDSFVGWLLEYSSSLEYCIEPVEDELRDITNMSTVFNKDDQTD